MPSGRFFKQKIDFECRPLLSTTCSSSVVLLAMSESPQPRCSQLNCRQFMPFWDTHSKCFRCRETLCSEDATCEECEGWTVEVWASCSQYFRDKMHERTRPPSPCGSSRSRSSTKSRKRVSGEVVNQLDLVNDPSPTNITCQSPTVGVPLVSASTGPAGGASLPTGAPFPSPWGPFPWAPMWPGFGSNSANSWPSVAGPFGYHGNPVTSGFGTDVEKAGTGSCTGPTGSFRAFPMNPYQPVQNLSIPVSNPYKNPQEPARKQSKGVLKGCKRQKISVNSDLAALEMSSSSDNNSDIDDVVSSGNESQQLESGDEIPPMPKQHIQSGCDGVLGADPSETDVNMTMPVRNGENVTLPVAVNIPPREGEPLRNTSPVVLNVSKKRSAHKRKTTKGKSSMSQVTPVSEQCPEHFMEGDSSESGSEEEEPEVVSEEALSYMDKIKLVLETQKKYLPETLPQKKKKVRSSLIGRDSQPETEPIPQLPIAEGIRSELLARQEELISLQVKAKSVKVFKMPKRPKPPMNWYNACDDDFPVIPPRPSPALNKFVKSGGPSTRLEITPETLINWEAACRSSLHISSHSDWFLATAHSLLDSLAKRLESKEEVDRASLLSTLRGSTDLLASVAKAYEDRLVQDTYLFWSMHVLRRDSYLSSLSFSPDPEVLSGLRAAPVCRSSKTEDLESYAQLCRGMASSLESAAQEVREKRRDDVLFKAPILPPRQGQKNIKKGKHQVKGTEKKSVESTSSSQPFRSPLASAYPQQQQVSFKGKKTLVPGEKAKSHTNVSVPLEVSLPLHRDLLPGSSSQLNDLNAIGARLNAFWRVWEQEGASPWIVSILRKGFSLRFKELPPLSSRPLPFSLPVSLLRRQALHAEILEMIEKGAVEQAQDSSPGFYSRVFVVPKTSGGWRPVIDLSALNKFLVVPKFSMETAESIRLAMPLEAWVVSLDLKDAYFHIPIHKMYRKYLRFSYLGQVWQFRALPFGLAPAPWIFTMVVKEIQIMAHRQGWFLHQYLDDWVLRHQCKVTLAQHRDKLLTLCQRLGLVINPKKSELTPQQDFVFVGYRYQTKLGIVLPSQERIDKICLLVSLFCHQRTQPALLWQSLLGLMSSSEKLIPLARLHMRCLQQDLKSQWSQVSDSADQLVHVSELSMRDLRWWLNWSNLTVGCPFRPPTPTVHLFTDASKKGWGAHWDYAVVSGQWSGESLSWHINVQEMEAVILAMSHWQSRMQNPVVLVASDNSTVVSYINKQGGTRSLSLTMQVRRLLLWCHANVIQLRARHIPGKMNVLADSLSRAGQILPTEWSLSPRVFRALCQLWESPLVDLFATRWNHKLPQFVSPIPDPSAWQVDALSMDWDQLYGYAYPPTALIPHVLSKVASHHCKLMLVVPMWPDKSWFPDLLNLLVDHPRALPLHWDLLKQPRSSVFHNQPGSLRLHACLLSNNLSERKDFLQRCPLASQNQIETLLWRSTNQSGPLLQLGVVGGRLILSKPLYL